MSDELQAKLAKAVRAAGRYFDALEGWSRRNQNMGDVHAVPAGSQPRLDVTLEEAIDAVVEALEALGDR